MTPLVAIPVKPFGAAKERLGDRIPPEVRARLGRAVSSRTVWAARASGAEVAVITADEEVLAWAQSIGVRTVAEPGTGLDSAAGAAVQTAAREERPWIVLHGDLPLVEPRDIAEVVSLLESSEHALAPSHDGGTSAVGSRADRFTFSYGPHSFHRHFAAVPRAAVVTGPGFAHDLDTLHDLDTVRRLGAAWWIDPILEGRAGVVEVRVLASGQWRTLRDLRLRALLDAPNAFRSTHADESTAPLENWAAWVARSSADADTRQLVAYVDGTPVGLALAGIREDVGAIGGMWVDPAGRRRGVGRTLVDSALAFVRSRRIRRCRLAVTIGNTAAEHLYSAAGFRPTGETEPLREGSDAMVSWLERTV